MQFTKQDALIAAGIAIAAAAVGAGTAYLLKKRNPAPSDSAVKKAATPETPVELTEGQISNLSKFNDLFISIPTSVEFNRAWHEGKAESMVGALKNDLGVGAFNSKDAAGRRIVIIQSTAGVTHIAYERFSGDRTTIETYHATNGTPSVHGHSIDQMKDELAAINNNEKIVQGEVVGKAA